MLIPNLNLDCDVVKIHERLFPKATFKSQLIKVAEEIKEYYSATTPKDKADELGDLLLVINSLFRFKETAHIGLDLYLFYTDLEDKEKCKKALLKSIKKVERRCKAGKYIFNGEEYVREKKDE